MKGNDCLSEKKIKLALGSFLTSRGWNPQVAWGSARGIDVEAKRSTDRWIIEVKVLESSSSMIVNSFISVLGEILQRMNDQHCKYSIALPDSEPFRRLWERLPALAKDRTGITALFVNAAGTVKEIP